MLASDISRKLTLYSSFLYPWPWVGVWADDQGPRWGSLVGGGGVSPLGGRKEGLFILRNFSIPHLYIVEEGVPGELGILENSKTLTPPPLHTHPSPTFPLHAFKQGAKPDLVLGCSQHSPTWDVSGWLQAQHLECRLRPSFFSKESGNFQSYLRVEIFIHFSHMVTGPSAGKNSYSWQSRSERKMATTFQKTFSSDS